MTAPAAARPMDAEGLMAWAIGRECADLICEREGPGDGVSRDGCFAISRYGRLGTFVDCSRDTAQLTCHAEAEAAYMTATTVLDGPELALVRHCARHGTRPNWRPFKVITAEPAELVYTRGKWRPRTRRAGGGAVYTPIRWRDRGAELVAWRGAYLRWHGALVRLEPAFPELAPLRAPERPWE